MRFLRSYAFTQYSIKHSHNGRKIKLFSRKVYHTLLPVDILTGVPCSVLGRGRECLSSAC